MCTSVPTRLCIIMVSFASTMFRPAEVLAVRVNVLKIVISGFQ